ncbi:MAG: exo-alpha-sialidase [Caldilinea sp. CFX5]|nr:exo-alpha-sialidase [Caldilinea sp. CFX5]
MRVMVKQTLLYVGSILMMLSITYSLSSLRLLAQGPTAWSPQTRIPGYADDASPPYLVADQNRTVHAFTSQQVSDEGKEIAIVYNQWTLANGWTSPIDIILSPIKHEARLLGAFLDQTGMMHLIFFGGDETEANLYYTKAPATNMNNANVWLPPVAIGKDALVPETGAIAGDDQGRLVVVYGGVSNNAGLFSIFSTNGGDTWSEPVALFFVYEEDVLPTSLQMQLGQSGWLHMVWNMDDNFGYGRGVYYARLKVGESQWSEPVMLVSVDGGLGTKTPTIIEQGGTLFAVYYNATMDGHLVIQRSEDGGQSWSQPLTPFIHVGMNDAGSFVVDSQDQLHLLFGQRITDAPDIHGMWHSVWRGGNWSGPEAVVSGPRVVDTKGDSSFDPINARAVNSQGNVLLVTWRTDFCCKPNGVWYSYKVLDTPELSLAPLPTQPAPPVATPVSILIPTVAAPTPTQSSVLSTVSKEPRNVISGPAATLLVSLAPVVVLVSLVIVYRFAAYRRL